MNQPSNTVEADILYLERSPIFEVEKPYVTVFSIAKIEGARPSNHSFEKRRCSIRNARAFGPFAIEQHGFTFLNHETQLSHSDFCSDRIVEEVYYLELAKLLRQHFPKFTDFVFLDHEYRQRSEDFPHNVGAEVKHSQPLTLPHVDFTPEGASHRLKETLQTSHQDLIGRPFEILNIWRTLNEPNNDWPLALCDYTTVDVEQDPINNDIVFRETIGENQLLFFNPNHQWYYLSDQLIKEIIVFRNATSGSTDLAKAWHAAFDNKDSFSGKELRRESLEVRVAAFTR